MSSDIRDKNCTNSIPLPCDNEVLRLDSISELICRSVLSPVLD